MLRTNTENLCETSVSEGALANEGALSMTALARTFYTLLPLREPDGPSCSTTWSSVQSVESWTCCTLYCNMIQHFDPRHVAPCTAIWSTWTYQSTFIELLLLPLSFELHGHSTVLRCPDGRRRSHLPVETWESMTPRKHLLHLDLICSPSISFNETQQNYRDSWCPTTIMTRISDQVRMTTYNLSLLKHTCWSQHPISRQLCITPRYWLIQIDIAIPWDFDSPDMERDSSCSMI